VLGISLAAPIGSATAAPALAVAFWRAGFGTLATAPVVAWRARAELVRLGGRGWWTSVASGAMLAAHFGLWIPSLRLTSVTVSTALVATTPVWIVALHLLTRVAVPRAVVGGVALALAGVLLVTGVDAARSVTALLGDLLALGGGMAAAGYTVLGERVRWTTSTGVYTLIAYGTCALLIGPLCLVLGIPLSGYAGRTWLELAVLTGCAQLLGHSVFAVALPAVGATPLSLAILLEVPGAALVAWLWLGQRPPLAALPGAVLVVLGLAVVVRGSASAPRVRPPDAGPR
jgi:drug/metabolite transporter (DMT)-like permease